MTALRNLIASGRDGIVNRYLLIRFCLTSSRARTAALLGGAVLNGVFSTVMIIASSAIVADTVAALRSGGLRSAAGHRLFADLGVVTAAILLGQTATATRRLLADTIARRVGSMLRSRAMAAITTSVRLGALDDAAIADDIGTLATVETRRSVEPAVIGVAETLAARLSALGPLVIVALFRWWLAVALALTWAAVRGYLGVQNRRRTQVLMGQSARLRAADYFRAAGTTSELAKEIRIFGLSGWITGLFRQHWTTAIAKVWADRNTARPPLALCVAAVIGVNVLAYLFLIARMRAGEVSLENFTAVALSIGTTAGIAGLAGMYGVDLALAPINAMRAVEQSHAGEPRMVAGISGSQRPRQGIRLADVSFRYRGAARDTIRSVSLEIPAGAVVGLAGANGAGKSTLAKIIMGLYPPTAGQVLIDGVDLEEYDLDSLWSGMGVLFQDYGKYPGSLRFNVDGGRAAQAAAPEQAYQAVADALDLRLIADKLPDGWQTPVSRAAPGGVDLSGGQWQRLALARALVAAQRGARLIVLDEPTANLDPQAEADFFDTYLELRGSATSLLISHRFPTLRRADFIAVLSEGRLVQCGSHQELIAEPGLYETMFEMQAAAYLT
jgi:ABC-type multidrug transport system fused ATPase/permease subunit